MSNRVKNINELKDVKKMLKDVQNDGLNPIFAIAIMSEKYNNDFEMPEEKYELEDKLFDKPKQYTK